MPNAELVIHGTVLTVDESQPTAEALAVIDGRIAAVGSRADVEPFIGPDTEVLDIGDGCPRHCGPQGCEVRPRRVG